MNITLKPGLILGDQGSLFDPETGDTFTMNETGLLLLQKMQAGWDIETIFEEIQHEYKLDRSDFNRMALDFKAMLKSFQLLQNE